MKLGRADGPQLRAATWIIDDQLNGYHLKQAKPSMLKTYGRIADACAESELSPPSRATVIRRLNRINRRLRELRRNGRKAAEAVTPRHGRFDVRVARAVYQVDHTLADVIIVDSKHRKPIGRPSLTLPITARRRGAGTTA